MKLSFSSFLRVAVLGIFFFFPFSSSSSSDLFVFFGFPSLLSLRPHSRRPLCLSVGVMSSLFPAVAFPSLSPSKPSVSLPSSPVPPLAQPRSPRSPLAVSELGAQRFSVFAQRPPSANQSPRSTTPCAPADWLRRPSSRRVTRQQGGAGPSPRPGWRAGAVSVSVRGSRARGSRGAAGDSAAESSRSPAAGRGEGIERFPRLHQQLRNHNSNRGSGILSQERGFQ